MLRSLRVDRFALAIRHTERGGRATRDKLRKLWLAKLLSTIIAASDPTEALKALLGVFCRSTVSAMRCCASVLARAAVKRERGSTRFRQMAGRAGRVGHEDCGEVCLLARTDEDIKLAVKHKG